MKVLQLFACFTNEEFAALIGKYQTEQDLKMFLFEKMLDATQKEVEQIKNDKALAVLGAERKL